MSNLQVVLWSGQWLWDSVRWPRATSNQTGPVESLEAREVMFLRTGRWTEESTRGCWRSLLLRDLREAQGVGVSSGAYVVVWKRQEGPGEAARSGSEEAGRHGGGTGVDEDEGHLTGLQRTDGFSRDFRGVGQVLSQTCLQLLVHGVLEFLICVVPGDGLRLTGARAGEKGPQHLEQNRDRLESCPEGKKHNSVDRESHGLNREHLVCIWHVLERG